MPDLLGRYFRIDKSAILFIAIFAFDLRYGIGGRSNPSPAWVIGIAVNAIGLTIYSIVLLGKPGVKL